MNMFNFESVLLCEEYYGGSANPYTFNYNIVVKIKNGPIKKFFYKDDCYYERYEVVKEGLYNFIKNMYERDHDIEIIAIPNIVDNENKYEGIELIKTGTFSGEFKIKD